jgi:isoleucyl-tRNA synthetase
LAENEKNTFIEMEHEVLKFWEDNKCFDLLREKNADKEPFRFIDGPITANNPMGIHHAWGRTLKDTFIRYKMMRGYSCRCQNGFDAQGLWVEVEVEKELGFKTKKDIEAYGMDRFTRQCVDRVKKFSSIITEQSKRLGQWMDWDNSYFTHTDKNIAGIWHFLKVCNEKGMIEREYRPMPWCPRCGTSLSEHEMTGSYKQLTHNSVFFKLPLKEIPSKILAWTTTPWTLSSNVALAVNPEIDYAEVRVKSDEQTIYLAKNAISRLGDDKLEVLRVVKGSELVGLHYETCFPEIEAQAGVEHKVVSWDEVAADEGTGIVHIAPGCGIEDYELGLKLNLPQIMPVDDMGIFMEGFGFMTGKDSHSVAEDIFERLKADNKLYKVEPYEHSYPLCWRCKAEIIFRLVPAWYIRTEAIKPELIKAAESVKWEPEANGKRMVDWLQNMGDWNISRKRYYGLPLPFYPCDCGHVNVIGSREELRERSTNPEVVDALPELHRPWIDEVKIKCEKCGKEVSRVNEIGDVWLDAGIVPFSTLGYFEDKEYWKKYFPADWVVEMREQVRLWFYSMLFMSVVLEGRAPYRRVLSHNSVIKEDGGKFSKTGYMIKFDEAAEIMGADTIRYLYAGAPVANDVRFGYNLGDEARRKLLAFSNIYTFIETYASIDKPVLDGYTPDISAMTATDKWLVLRTNEFIARATECFDDFKAYTLVKDFEVFVDDISNWYIRTNRRRFWKTGDMKDKTLAYWVLTYALDAATRCMSPIIPFMTENIWQKLIRKLYPSAPISVHLCDWPVPFEGVTDTEVLEQTALARDVINTAMRLRNEQQLKVRQPLSTLYVCCSEADAEKIKVFEKTILDELNIRSLEYITDMAILKDSYLTVNFKAAGAVLKQDVNKLKAVLEGLDDAAMAKAADTVAKGGSVRFDSFDIDLAPELFVVQSTAKKGIVVGEVTDELTVAIDTHLTDELIADGIVRDIVRQWQILRKDTGYSVEQRILAAVKTADEFTTAAVTNKSDYIKSELLADDLIINGDLAADADKTFEVNGAEVTIFVKSV